MGNSMAFWAGDAERIAAGIDAPSFDEDDPLGEKAPWVAGYVDFSLNLSLEHFDTLTMIVANLVSAPPMQFSTEIHRNLRGDRSRAWGWRAESTDTLSARWVALMASIPEARALEIATTWCAGWVVPDQPSEASVEAIRDLIRLCVTATQKRVPVLFDFCA